MSGMVLVSKFGMRTSRGQRPLPAVLVHHVDGPDRRVRGAYPINWWMVANHMKHGMITVRREAEPTPMGGKTMGAMSGDMSDESSPADVQPSSGVKAAMTVLTFAILGAALVIVVQFAL